MKTRLNLLITAFFLTAFVAVGNISANGTELSASSHVETEETMNLEYWMLNKDYHYFFDALIIENEEELRIENWMTAVLDTETVKLGDFVQEEDPKMNLEEWMTKS